MLTRLDTGMNVHLILSNDVCNCPQLFQYSSFDSIDLVNVAKWILANLFDYFIREEAKTHHQVLPSTNSSHRRHIPIEEKNYTKEERTWSSNKTISVSVNAPSMIPAIPISKSIDNDTFLTPVPSVTTPVVRPRLSSDAPLSPKNISTKDTDYFNSKFRRGSIVSSVSDDFSGWGGPGTTKDANTLLTPSVIPSSPGGGGLMGKLRQFGKGSKRPSTGDVATISVPVAVTPGAQESEGKVCLHPFTK